MDNNLKRILLFLIFAYCSNGAIFAKEALQGEVEELAPTTAKPVAPKEAMPMPVLPEKKSTADGVKEEGQVDQEKEAPLHSEVQKSQLTGKEDWDESQENTLKAMPAKVDLEGNRLKGSAHKEDTELAGEDPDAQDQELQIEWDRWRNRFLRAVLAETMENLNNPQATEYRWDPVTRRVSAQFPLGTTSWFACQISNAKHISNLKIVHSSGYPNYDRAVLDALRSLEGTSILRFPTRSRRTIVSQAGGVRTSDQPQQEYFHFGDVEHVRVPAN